MGEQILFDGMEISDSSELAAVLRRQFSSGILSGNTTDHGPEEALWRLVHSIKGTHLEQVFADALMQLLTDSDVETRTSAVALAQDVAERLEPGQLLALLDEHPTLFKNVQPKGQSKSDFHGDDLAWGLLRAIAGHPSRDDKVLTRLKAAARDPQHGARVLAGLTVSDP